MLARISFDVVKDEDWSGRLISASDSWKLDYVHDILEISVEALQILSYQRVFHIDC